MIARGLAPRIMAHELRYAGWLNAPWPSTMIISGCSVLYASITAFSISPVINSSTIASIATPYFAP